MRDIEEARGSKKNRLITFSKNPEIIFPPPIPLPQKPVDPEHSIKIPKLKLYTSVEMRYRI